jgi:hypothetical protein
MMDNGNTAKSKAVLSQSLQKAPDKFRDRIVEAYIRQRQAFEEGEADTVGLRGGKFCEEVLRFLQFELTGTFTPFGTKIPNFTDDCKKLTNLPKTAGSESLRVIMPRALDFAYTLRNKRGIGHAAGDIDANLIDAATSARIADWCMCELMRNYHSMSIEDAQALLDTISVRQLPKIWTISSKKRVLNHKLNKKQQTLALLHGELQTGIPVEDLCSWVEYSSLNMFKKRILEPLHDERLIEFDTENDMAIISPKGARMVDEVIYPQL